MIDNRVSFEISEQQKADFKSSADALIALAEPLQTPMNKEEIKSLAKIGDGRIPFVEKVAEFAVKNPKYVPPYGDVEEFQKDFQSFKDFREMVYPLLQILQSMMNSGKVSGSEAYDFARQYYKSVKYHADMGDPVAQSIYQQLKPLFEAKNTSAPEE